MADNTDIIHRSFSDFATFSSSDRTAVSIRDGVLEYLGVELGLEPSDKVFTVYRSPATIANAAYKMPSIPLTDEHIDMSGPAPDTGSSVESSEVIDQLDEATSSRLAVLNRIKSSDAMNVMLQDKRQLSLGYDADLIPHSKWDFEQVNIIPHHLAAVRAGRCGPLCSFLDRKPPTAQEGKPMPQLFYDEDGAVNLEQVAEIATGLPEAIRKIPVDKLSELIPSMQEIMAYATEQGVMVEDENTEEMEEVETMDADKEEKDKPNFKDSQEFKDAVEKMAVKIADSEIKKFGEVVNKAREFLDSEYTFEDKDSKQVMRDALATQYDAEFSDQELDVAFKMLRPVATDLRQFGDSKSDSALESRLKSELGEE